MSSGGDSKRSSQEWLASTILSAADAAGIGVAVIGSLSRPELLGTTRVAQSLLGRAEGELRDVDVFSLLGGSDERESIRQRLESMTPQSPTFEVTTTRPNGERVSLDVGGATAELDGNDAVILFVSDVTQRRLALESLEKSEERFRSVVERVPEAVFMTTGTSLSYANRAFLEFVGISNPEAARGVDVLDFVHADDAASVRDQIKTLASGLVGHAEYRMQSADGRLVVLEVSCIRVEFDGQSSVLWLGQDVTARKELEGRLLQADRLAVLGTLSAGMAHAINNPLSYTLLNLEHVARRMRHLVAERDYYAEARVRLGEAHDGADRVARIVRQMRALSRSRPSPAGPVDLRAVIDSVLAMVGNEIRHRGQLTMRSDPTPFVFGTESELEQAFLGLLVHVARSLPDEAGGGREVVLSTGTHASGYAFVTVSDDGPALSEDAKSRLFDPFGSGEAAGLGLPMCQAILTSLEGRIDVESSEGRGTTFRVLLPPAPGAVNAESPHSSSTTPLPPASRVAKRARVLVIDDDPGVGSTLRAMLEVHHEVKSVENGRDGLKALLGDEEFDVVFCDLVMPDLSGIDVYCTLELNRPERAQRLIFMTGDAYSPEAERFLAQVPNLRLEKPFSLTRVEQLLSRAVTAHREADRTRDA